MKWPDYLNTHGRCEVDSAPFECKICGSVVHYSGTRIDSHLKNVHKITWAEYIDYIRSMQRGLLLKELPKIDVYTCKICNVSVKLIKKHLKSTHKVTEHELCIITSIIVHKSTLNMSKSARKKRRQEGLLFDLPFMW